MTTWDASRLRSTVDGLVAAYLALHSDASGTGGGYCLATFADLEGHVVQGLRARLPGLSLEAGAPEDPNEIALEDDAEGREAQAEVAQGTGPSAMLRSLGLPSLRHHPEVQQFFGAFGDYCLKASDVYQHLVAFLATQPPAPDMRGVDLEAFEAHLLQAEGLAAISDAGVQISVVRDEAGRIGQGLFREVQEVKEVVNAKRLQQAAWLQAQLRDLQGAAPPPKARGSSSRKRAREGSAYLEGETVLLPPTRPSLGSFLTTMKERWAKQSPYSPSYGKLRKEVEKGGWGGTKAVYLDICTEYAMLHLGSRAYRAARFGLKQRSPGEPRQDAEVAMEALPARAAKDGEGVAAAAAAAAAAAEPSAGDGNPSGTPLARANVSQSAAPLASQQEPPKNAPQPGAAAHPPAGAEIHVFLEHHTSPSTDATDLALPFPRASGFQASSSTSAVILPGPECVPVTLPEDLPPLALWEKRALGRWGEALVYQTLLARGAPGARVDWVNRQEETRAPYDISVEVPSRERPGRWDTNFVEVKTTAHAEKNAFEISPTELDFLRSGFRGGGSGNFHIYRVYADAQRPRIVVIEDVARALETRAVKLYLAV